MPIVNVFGPVNTAPLGEDVVLSVEEYETIRLLDLEGLTQEEAAKRMDVARTTVQRMYAQARQKIAVALFEGSLLRIEGGNYEFYQEGEFGHGCRRCGRERRGQMHRGPGPGLRRRRGWD